MEYKASKDNLCIGITIGAIVLFMAIGFIIAGQKELYIAWLPRHLNTPFYIHSGIIAFYVAIILVSYTYAPKSYSLSDTAFTVNRPVKNKVFKLADITQVRLVESSQLRGTIRTFGNGGLFGYYGRYYNSILGRMTWYITQRKNRILITLANGKKILVSPDDIGLLDALQSRISK